MAQLGYTGTFTLENSGQKTN